MNKDTNNIVFYILMFFIAVVILGGSFAAYRIFFPPDISIEIINVEDEEFDNIFNEKRKENTNKEKEYAEYEKPACVINGVEWKHGSIKDFYSNVSVGVYESCADFSVKKRCDNGFWLGDKKFPYASCERTVDCKLDEKTVIPNLDSVKLYSRDSVPYGDDCEKYKGIRTCRETILTGDAAFKYKTCKVSNAGVCVHIDAKGQKYTIPDGSSHVFYNSEKVSYDDICGNHSKNRICSKGILYGSPEYKFWSCSKAEAAQCYLDGNVIEHGETGVFYSKKAAEDSKTCKFFAQIRTCNNGILDGQEEYSYSECME